jgi:hypothetical protein
MRYTADVTGGKPIAVRSQSISDVSAGNPLVARSATHPTRFVLFYPGQYTGTSPIKN